MGQNRERLFDGQIFFSVLQAFVFFVLAGALHLFGSAEFVGAATREAGALVVVFSLIAGAAITYCSPEEVDWSGAIMTIIGGGVALLVATTLSGWGFAVTLLVLVAVMAYGIAEHIVGPEPHFISWYLAAPLGTTLGLIFAIVANWWWPILIFTVADLGLKYLFWRDSALESVG